MIAEEVVVEDWTRKQKVERVEGKKTVGKKVGRYKFDRQGDVEYRETVDAGQGTRTRENGSGKKNGEGHEAG